MAELDTEPPSSVSPFSDLDTSGGSGSGLSEVNKGRRETDVGEDSHLDNHSISSSNISNNFKSNNCLATNNIHDENITKEQALDQDGDICKQNDVEFMEAEVQENKKNEQMSQQLSNGSADTAHKESLLEAEKDESVNDKYNGSKKIYKKKRGVRFPDDSSITCCCDPPDPWKNAPSWTTDELITAYKKSCEMNGSKPVVKILQQLHGISSPGKRKESFVLKGEKLDQKQVECIEEILRRVQFTLIDLEATHLDDETAVALFDMIEHYESACQLNISFNRNISARGWQACSRLVRRTPTLNFLDIRNCDLNERTIPLFGRALKMGCHLTVLHMEGMSLTTRPLIILVAALKMNDTLQELFLAENKLVPSDGVQLGNLLRYNHKLNLLDLRNNNLQDVGISHLCDGLVEQKSGHGLRTLVLWNNQISYQAMHALGRAIANSASLETLNIGHNGITNEGIHQVKDGLLKTTSLLRLGLQGTRISDEGAVALAEYIADSTILLRIDLRDNDIKTGGLMALSHAMRVNNSVTRIDLDKETKKESGMKEYAEVQIRLLRDILTFQERNVQLVMEREEAERARLEKLAIEAEAVREKEKTEKDNGGSTPLDQIVSNTESFTIIEADSDEMSQETQASSSEYIVNVETLSLAPQVKTESSIPLPSKTFSEEEEHMPAHQRPSVLFARMGLQPQESLDSPRTPSDSSQVFQSPQNPSFATPQRPHLPLMMPEKNRLSANTPPAEMLLSPQYYPKQLARKIFSVSRVSEDVCSSPSGEELCEYDPLNVSLISLVPGKKNLHHPSASPVLSPDCSNTTDTSLTSTESTSSSVVLSPASLFQDRADETVKHIVSSDEPDLPCKDSLSSTAESRSEETVTSESDIGPNDNCDKHVKSNNSYVVQCTISPPAINNSVEGTGLETIKIAEVDQLDENVDLASDVILSEKVHSNSNAVYIEDSKGANLDIPESSDCSEFQVKSSQGGECVEGTKEDFNDDDNDFDSNRNDEIEILESIQSVATLVDINDKSDKNELHTSLRNLSALSSSQSSALKTSFVKETAMPTFSPHNNEKEEVYISNDKRISFPEISLTTTTQDNFSNLDEETKTLFLDKNDHSTTSGVELDGVELSLEEEPWTALEKDGSTMGSSSNQTRGEENQPDFFTTLSMNGLTQELASALTSLDVVSTSECDEVSGPDEFEQELDALMKQL